MNYKEMAEAAKKAKTGKSLSPKFHDWKTDGDTIVGRLLGTNLVESASTGQPYKQYLVETDTGLVKFHLGGFTDSEISSLIVIGHVYLVENLGKEKLAGGRSINNFSILDLTPDQPAPAHD